MKFHTCSRVSFLIHNYGAHRTNGAAITASQTFVVVDFGETVIIVKDCTGRASSFASTAAFTVFLINVNFFLRYVRIVIERHGAVEILN